MEETRVAEMLDKLLLTSHALVWLLEMKILYTLIYHRLIYMLIKKNAKIIFYIYIVAKIYIAYHEQDQRQLILF